MRDLLTGVAILLILAMTAAFAAPWFIDWTAWRGQAEERLSQALGRTVRIGGDLSLRLLPQPRLSAGKITVEAAQAPASLTAERVELELSLTALFSGELRVTDGVVEGPVVTLRDAPAPSGARPATLLFTTPFSIERLSVRDAELRLLAGDGRMLFAARGDLGVESMALAGPWKAQGRVEVEGRRYDVRWASGAMDEAGRAALKLAVQDANFAFVADADGTLVVDRKAWRQPPKFEGRVNASGTLAWPFGKAAGQQPWRLTAVGDGDLEGFLAREVELEAGPQDTGVKADGEGELKFAQGGSGRLTVKARPIDVDRMLAVDPGQSAPAMPTASAAEAERFLAAIPFPIALDLTAERFFAQGESFGPVRVNAKLEPGVIVLDRSEAQLPGGARATATGRAWIDSEPAVEGAVTLSASAPAKAWAWATGAATDPTANPRFARASEASASGKVRWRPGRIALDDAAVTLDGAKAQVSAQRRFATQGDPGRIGVDIKADRLDLDLLPPLGSVSATGTGPDLNILVAAKEVVAANLGAASIGSLDLEARRMGGVLTLQRLTLKNQGLALTADGVVKDGAGRFATELSADDVRPLAMLLQRAFPGRATDALLQRAAALSPARLNGAVAPTRDAQSWSARLQGSAGDTRIDASVEARVAVVDGQQTLNVDTLRVEAGAADSGRLVRQLGWDASSSDQPGSLSLQVANPADAPPSFTLAGALAGARIDASGKAASTLAPGLIGKLRLDAPDVRPLLRLLGASAPASEPAQPARFESDAEFGIGGLTLTNLAGVFGAKPVKASSLQIVIGDDAKAVGQAEVGDLSLVELSLMILGVDPTPGATGFWSSTRFPSFSAWSLPFDLDLRAPRLALGGGWVATGAALKLVSRPDGLRIESATADFAGGRIGVSGAVRRDGSLAALSGRIDATGLDMTTLGATGVAGQLELSLDLAGSGDAISRIVAGLGGAGAITLRRLAIPALDPSAVARVSALLAKRDGAPTSASVLALIEQELTRSPLTLGFLSAPLTLANGSARIGPARADAAEATVAGSAQFDVRALTLDARGTVAPRQDSGVAGPEIGVGFSGPLAAPRRTIDIAALFSDITQKAAAREATRIETIEQDQRERSAFNRRLRAERDRLEAEERARRAAEPARSGSIPPPPVLPSPDLRPPSPGQ